jgi:4-hydroxy-4-methyl-2-oxoglutarate aldolase
MPTLLTADELAAVRAFPTPTVANALERLGVPGGFTGPGVLAPFPNMPAFVGYAVTLTVRSSHPIPKPIARKPYWDYVQVAAGPKVVVAQELEHPAAGAYWGEVNASIHIALGCVGLLTDGAVRDLDEVGRLGFPFLAGSVTVSHAHAQMVGFGEPVTVFGLRVRSGDLIHADRHGAVVIPPAVAKNVAAACRAIEEYERPILALCRAGDLDPAALAKLLGDEVV